ncbi:MAG: alpha/beta hydrolase [Clostridiales bacterium]|nr:alpha/beta hydrolase [Clostridiales bacterium]
MKERFAGAECEYECNFTQSDGERVVLFLHGWGGCIKSFSAAYNAVTELGYKAVNFAFPTEVPPEWGVYEYAAHVHEFIRSHNIINPIVVGHSFGGRVGIILAAKNVCGGLVLVDSAGMKPRPNLLKKLRVARYHYRVKHGKPLDGMGSKDYNSLDKSMRPVFVRIVNTFLERLLGLISCPSLIVWGRRDKDTPPYMARRINRGIKGSKLVYLDGDHFCYLQSHYAFINLLKTFLSETV